MLNTGDRQQKLGHWSWGYNESSVGLKKINSPLCASIYTQVKQILNAENGTQILKDSPIKKTRDYLIKNPQDTDETEAWERHWPKTNKKTVRRTLNVDSLKFKAWLCHFALWPQGNKSNSL